MNRGKWIALCGMLLVGSAAVAANPDAPRPLPALLGGPPPLPSERVDADLAYLKTALKITPDQVEQWSKVADVLRAMARHRDAQILAMRAALDSAAGRPPDPITALEHRQAGLAEQARDLADLIAAAKPLYARFEADQKKAAEWLVPPPAGPLLLERRLAPPGRLPPIEPPAPE